MFCPKCGSQNADETKFCRGCGGDISNVLAVVDGKAPRAGLALAEKQIELSSTGWRGLLGGLGFLIVAGLASGVSGRVSTFALFMLVFGFVFIATGVSRFIQVKGLKRLLKPPGLEHERAISSGETAYIQPPRSLFETDDLTATPRSVTEKTTTHLELDRDAEKG